MFGFKLIKEREYDDLCTHAEEAATALDVQLKQKADLEKEVENLRSQLNYEKGERKKIISEINGLRIRLDNLKKDAEQQVVRVKNDAEMRGLKVLSDMCILHDNDYPCSRCQLKSKDCQKLTFANRTICVTDKKNVNSFCRINKK